MFDGMVCYGAHFLLCFIDAIFMTHALNFSCDVKA